VNAHTLGQFFALWEMTTAIAGELLHVNPYDQPGVELGKVLAAEKLR
jgi:glucose-6-phosphate isomerase